MNLLKVKTSNLLANECSYESMFTELSKNILKWSVEHFKTHSFQIEILNKVTIKLENSS